MKNLVWKQPGNMFKQQHNHALEMSDYPFLHTKELGVVPKKLRMAQSCYYPNE